MKKLIILSLILVQTAFLLAVFDDYIPSARARGMGGAYTAVADDINSIFFNPAGLTNVNIEVMAGYSSLYGQEFSEYKTGAFGFRLPQKLGTLAFSGRMFDIDFDEESLMSEQIWSASHAFNLQSDIHSQISLGYTVNFNRLQFDGEKTDTAVAIDLGATALLHGRTKFGFCVSNLNQAVMGDSNQNTLPSRLALGISYLPYDRVTTSIEIKKDFAQETEFMAGVEALLFDPLSIRFGVHQNPATWNGGIGLELQGLKIDLSYSTHTVLPGTFYTNLGYEF